MGRRRSIDLSPVSGAQEQRWNKSAAISCQEFQGFSFFTGFHGAMMAKRLIFVRVPFTLSPPDTH